LFNGTFCMKLLCHILYFEDVWIFFLGHKAVMCHMVTKKSKNSCVKHLDITHIFILMYAVQLWLCEVWCIGVYRHIKCLKMSSHL
jgi:hypothetical protein